MNAKLAEHEAILSGWGQTETGTESFYAKKTKLKIRPQGKNHRLDWFAGHLHVLWIREIIDFRYMWNIVLFQCSRTLCLPVFGSVPRGLWGYVYKSPTLRTAHNEHSAPFAATLQPLLGPSPSLVMSGPHCTTFRICLNLSCIFCLGGLMVKLYEPPAARYFIAGVASRVALENCTDNIAYFSLYSKVSFVYDWIIETQQKYNDWIIFL